MDLKNNFSHNRGSAVQIEETVYAIDAEGIAHNVSQAHAVVLLQNRAAWQPLRSPVAEKEEAKPVEEPMEDQPKEKAKELDRSAAIRPTIKKKDKK